MKKYVYEEDGQEQRYYRVVPVFMGDGVRVFFGTEWHNHEAVAFFGATFRKEEYAEKAIEQHLKRKMELGKIKSYTVIEA